jgi:hypothetical protein
MGASVCEVVGLFVGLGGESFGLRTVGIQSIAWGKVDIPVSNSGGCLGVTGRYFELLAERGRALKRGMNIGSDDL